MADDINDVASQPDELDALLNEFETATSQPNGETQSSPAAGGDGMSIDWILQQQELDGRDLDLRSQRVELQNKERALVDHVQGYVTQRQLEQHQADLKTAVDFIRGDLDPKFFDDGHITAYLDKVARENPKLQELWLNRQNNPKALQIAMKHYAKEFQEKYKRMPDPNVTEDVAAVAAAMRGASGPPPSDPPKNYGRMSDQEWRNEMRELGLPVTS